MRNKLQNIKVRAIAVRTLIFFAAVIPALAPAQTMSPVRSEYRNKADGEFLLTNDTLTPMTVILEVSGMNVSETGEISYPPLDPGIKVRLSSNSLRVNPKQRVSVSYQATAKTLPAWFVIYAGFRSTPMRDKPGVTVQVRLPHVVYILTKKDALKSEIQVVSAVYDPAKKKVMLDVASASANFGRVQETLIYSGKKNADGPGFPLFPGKHRKIDLEWKGDSTPDRIVLEFNDFRIEAPVTISSK